MKTLDEYKKEIEQDPKARRRLRKLEKEFQAVEDSLTDEELVKYGLKPADDPDPESSSKQPAAVDSVIDVISHKI